MKKIICVISVFFMLTILGCGSGGSESEMGSGGDIQDALKSASREYGVPHRLMLAAAYLESGMAGGQSGVTYSGNRVQSSSSKSLSLGLTDTAFGLSRGTLQLSTTQAGDALPLQITSYARWVRANLDRMGVSKDILDNDIKDQDQLFKWIWKLAELHRTGDQQRNNIRVFFASEMINILNEGFVWQDPSTSEIIALLPEKTKIVGNAFSSDIQRNFMLKDDISQIPNARQFQLLNFYDYSVRNTPNHIEVIHCPLSLSACLELQSNKNLNQVYLGAHYVVQQNAIGDDASSVRLSKPLQLAEHEYPVYLTSEDGSPRLVKDAIVIMLVGRSGKYIDNIRQEAKLNWYTTWQLEKLGEVIDNVCNLLAINNSDVNGNACKVLEGASGGVKVHYQQPKQSYKWGDVEDYDKTTFLLAMTGRSSSIGLEFISKVNELQAGDPIKMKASFASHTEWLKLERAIRCSNQRIVWTNLQNESVRGRTSFELEKTIFDAGLNKNGQHYLRLTSYDAQNKITASVVKELRLNKFDDKASTPIDQACFY